MRQDRLHQLIKVLLAQNEFITISQLSTQLHISQRTIHNYLDSHDFFKIVPATILIKKPNKGIFIDCDSSTKANILMQLQTSLQLNSEQKSDFNTILLYLLTNKSEISLEELCNDLFITSSTLTSLLIEIEHYAHRYVCTIEHHKRRGVCICGNEISIRTLFYNFLNTHFKSDAVCSNAFVNTRIQKKTVEILHSFLKEDEVKQLINIMNVSENIMNTCYCDEDYNRLLIHLTIIISRTRLGFYIKSSNIIDIRTSQEYYYATLKKTYLEKDFQILLNEDEVCYIARLLLGTRKQVNIATFNQNIVVLEKFIQLLSIRLNVELTNDYELKQNLINHLKPAIHRMKHGVVSENPLLEQIRLNYTFIYIAVITTIEDLEVMENIYFDSNEIGYICLHIIAAVNRPENCKKIKTCLICNEGLSIEIFLKNLIESYFKEILICEIYRENSLKELHIDAYDMIINSTSQPILGHNVVQIQTSFTQHDHSTLRHYIMNCSTNTITSDIYHHYLMFFQDDMNSQIELLDKYCNFLLEHDYVKEGFYDSVISRTNISSTYIARGIALPHGAKDEVKSSIILMINLTKAILWDHEETDFIILVAANDTDAKNYSFLFRKIMKIAASDEYSQELKHCTNLDHLELLLEKVS